MLQSKPIGVILLWGMYFALFYFLYQIMSPFLYPIMWAGILTVIFYPAHKKIAARMKRHQALAAGITMVLIVIVVLIPGAFIISLLVSELIDFAKSIIADSHLDVMALMDHPYIESFIKRIQSVISTGQIDLKTVIAEKMRSIGAVIIHRAEGLILDIPSSFANFFLTMFTTFFLLRDGKSFVNLVKNLLPLSQSEIDFYSSNLKKVIYVTFIGVLLTAFAQGMAAFVGFYFIGISSSLLLGVVTAISSLVPVVGSALIWVPLSVYLLLTGSVLKGVLVLLVGVFVIGMIDNFVRPIFLNQYLSLHLLLTFFSLMGGIKAFGLIGIFLGPVIVSFFIGSCIFYQDYRIRHRRADHEDDD